MDKDKHSTIVLANEGGSALSIVLAGIAAANAAAEEYEKRASEEKAAGNLFPSNYFEGAEKEQLDMYFGLKEVLPFLPASTLPEAAAQIGHAINEICSGYDDMPEGKAIDEPYKAMQKKVERLLYSALRAVEAVGHFSLSQMGLENLRNTNCDPWAEVEDIVRQLRAEGVK